MGEDKNKKATDPRLVLVATAVSVALFLIPVCVSAQWGAGFAEGLFYGIGAAAAFSLLSGLLKGGRQGFDGRRALTRHAAALARILQVVVVLVPPAALIATSQTKPSSQAFLWGGLLVVIIVAAGAFLLWRRAARS